MSITNVRSPVRAGVVLCAATAALVVAAVRAQQPPAAPPAPTPTQTVVQALGEPTTTPAKSGTFSAEELEQMVAPIALYPDPLLAQVLMSSTYPLEVVEAARWSKANASVTGDAVAEALKDEDWDPSVKSIATFPDVLAMMDEKLDWTQKLGDAFLAQQAELMDAVQRLRAKAHDEGTLMSSKEQTVSVEPSPPPPADAAPAPAAAAAPAPPPTTIIKIEPTDPEIVYVPVYNPTVVYGPWPYPAYPPYYYYPPMYPPGAAFFTFTAGVIIGGAFWGNCNWGWGHSDVNININRYNEFNRNNINAGNNIGADGKWQHNPEHRKGAQYRDSSTQERFGRSQSSDAVQSREAFRGRADQGRRDLAAGGATRDLAGNQLGGQGVGNRAGGQPGVSNRAGGQGGTAATRPSTGTRPSTANRGSEAFRSSSSGSYTRSASQRGYSSRSAGGFSGGGFRGGGGGGRRR
jgi:hypothetical protein